MNTIYLVRHGQTDWNNQGLYQGHTNVPLNDLGLKQAKAVAEVLKPVHFDSIIASDLDRARITAEYIYKGRSVSFKTDKRLQEINFGEWEGLTYDQIEAKWPNGIFTMYRSPEKLSLPKGETFKEVQTRAWSAVHDEMGEVGEDKTILVVAHGGTNRTIICKILNLPLHYSWNFSQGNTSITKLQYFGSGEDDHNILNFLNDTKHLDTIK